MTGLGTLPALSGAWIRSSERAGDRLRLGLENVRRGGLVHAGEVVFTGVTRVEVMSDRPIDRPRVNPRPKGTITGVHVAPGVTTIDTRNQPGPGDEDACRFTITHLGIEVRLRASLGRTMRRLAGFYPLPADLDG